MKTHILVAGLVLATAGTVLIYPTLRGHAAGPRPPEQVAPLSAARTRATSSSSATGAAARC